jgi:hypothetical protein
MIYDPTSFNPEVGRQIDAAFAKLRSLEAGSANIKSRVVKIGDADFEAAKAFSVDLKKIFVAGVSDVRFLAIGATGDADTSEFTDDSDSALELAWAGDGAPEVVAPDDLPGRDDFLGDANSLLIRLTYVAEAGVAEAGVVVAEALYNTVS